MEPGASVAFEVSAMDNNGWIKLYRKLLDSRLWSLSGDTLKVAIYMLLKANHAPAWYKGVQIPRGGLVRSHGDIAEGCALGLRAVRHAIDKLEEDEFIKHTSPFGRRQVQMYLIVNYGIYQHRNDSEGAGPAQATAQGPAQAATNDQHNDRKTNKKDKKDKKDKNGRMEESSGRKKRGPSVPAKPRQAKPKPQRLRPDGSAPDPRVAEFFAWWDEAYQKRYGIKFFYANKGRSGAVLRRLLKVLDGDGKEINGKALSTLQTVAEWMFADEDQWVQDHLVIETLEGTNFNKWLNLARNYNLSGCGGTPTPKVPVSPWTWDELVAIWDIKYAAINYPELDPRPKEEKPVE